MLDKDKNKRADLKEIISYIEPYRYDKNDGKYF